MIFRPMRSHLVLIIQSNCCLHVTVEFHLGMEMYVLSGPKIFPIIGTLIKLHFKKIQVQIQVYKECNISVYIVIILFIFHLKSYNIWNKIKHTLLRQCAYVFNRYCRHRVTNISQCNKINRNREKQINYMMILLPQSRIVF